MREGAGGFQASTAFFSACYSLSDSLKNGPLYTGARQFLMQLIP